MSGDREKFIGLPFYTGWTNPALVVPASKSAVQVAMTVLILSKSNLPFAHRWRVAGEKVLCRRPA